MPDTLITKNKTSLDVTGAFDNCFFHTYATHILANKQLFPGDLFTFKSILGDQSHASVLQRKFADDPSLSLFEKQHKYAHPAEDAPSFIVEKTMILGFLLREWFATYMIDHQEIATKMQNDALKNFEGYIEFRGFDTPKDQLVSGDQGVLYLANEAFLEYAVLRNSGHFEPQPQFEKYFTGVDSATVLKNFWLAEGYSNYCKYIALPNTKLSFGDVAHVIEHFKQPITIYDKSRVDQEEAVKILKGFNKYITARVSGTSKEDLLAGDKKALYLANVDFLEYAVFRQSPHFTEQDKIRAFEIHFLGGNLQKALATFWLAEGYSNYNKFIEAPSTKISDVDDQLLVINEKNPEFFIYKNEGSEEHPAMEVTLNVQEGHYRLIRTEETAEFLEDYATSYGQYKKDREAILAHAGDKSSFAKTKASIFVSSILPTGQLHVDPFTLLVNKIDEQQTFVKETEKAIALEVERRALKEVVVVDHGVLPSNPDTGPLVTLPQVEDKVVIETSPIHHDPIVEGHEEEFDKPLPLVDLVGHIVHQQPLATPTKETKPVENKPVLPDIKNARTKKILFKNQLKELWTQVQDLKTRRDEKTVGSNDYNKLDAAYDKANTLHEIFKKSGKKYFNKEISFADFKKASDDAIIVAKPILETHRGWKETLDNIGQFLNKLFSSVFSTKVTFFKVDTTSMKKVNAVEDSVNKAEPEA